MELRNALRAGTPERKTGDARRPWISRGFSVKCICEPVDTQGRFGNFRWRSNWAFLQVFSDFGRALAAASRGAPPWRPLPRLACEPPTRSDAPRLRSEKEGFRTLFGGIARWVTDRLPLEAVQVGTCAAVA